MPAVKFLDRRDAGRRLAVELKPLAEEHPVIVALPRGGVPVGFEVARELHAPLEILAVRKLGAPGNPELGVGAVAEDGSVVLDARSAAALGMTTAMLDRAVASEARELRRRVETYRQGRAAMLLNGRAVIVVDDGLATGLSDLAAVRALRRQGVGQIVVATPVGSSEALALLEEEADRIVCLEVPPRLLGVGQWYANFGPVSDEQVMSLLSPEEPQDRD
jgi:putative phosphoribosyl transferase